MNYIFYCGEYEAERSFKEGADESCIDSEFNLWAANYEYENKIDDIEHLMLIGEAGYYKV